jgi:hypothetical protein
MSEGQGLREPEVGQTSLYLASMFGRGAEIADYADVIAGLGYHITSRWLSRARGGSNLYLSDAEAAQEDIDDIDRAQLLVHYTAEKGVYGTGGRHVEFGYAYARGKGLVTVGPHENVFQALPEVVRLPDHFTLLHWLVATHPAHQYMGWVDQHVPTAVPV